MLHLIAALGLVLTSSTTFLFGGGIASADTTPTVTSVSPSNGPMAGGTLVTIDGSGLSTVSAVSFGSVAASLFFANSDSELQAVSPAAAGPGPVDITVTNGAGSSSTSSSDVFTYTLAAPTVTRISPTSAAISGGTVLTISGTNFLNGQTSVTVGGITATNVGPVVQNGATSVITAVVPVTTNVGSVDVQVTNPTATSATSSGDLLTYTAPVPAVSALAPNNTNTANSATVTITGTGLLNGGTSVAFGSQAALSVGPVSIAGNYTVMTATNPLTTAVGGVDVRLTTAGGTSTVASTDKFTYTAGTPTVTAIGPLTGTTAGRTTITITGTNFLNGSSTVSFGGVPAGSVGAVSVVGSNTVMTATSPATTTSGGPVDVTVAITGATSATSASDVFTYTLVTPTVTAISPLTGTVAGKATVTITGTDFVAGATTVTFGGQAAAATGAVKFVGSNTVLTATAPMTTGTGAVDVEVTTPATTSAPVAADHFTYFAGVPSISSVSPNNGASAGGTTVTITGLGLLDGATTVTFGGIAATSVGAVSLSGNSAVMTATSPMTNAAAGIDVKVSTTGGSSALGSTDKFTYTAGTPAVSAISPVTGTTAGNTTMTITGTGLINGSTHVYFGGQQASAVGPVTVVGGNTVMTATSPVTTTSGGPVDITTSTGGGTSATSASDVFTYTLVTPTVTAVSPLTGTVAGKATVTITGTDFVAGATTVTFGGQAAAATGAVKFVGSNTVLTATAPMTTGTGAVDVQVTTPATTSAAVAQDQFTYYAGIPSISSVSPNSGSSAGGTTVTITGLGLLDGATTVTFGGIAATSVGAVSLSGNSAVMTATSPMTNAATAVDVRVSTTGGTSAVASTDKFTYTTGTPTVTSISPVTGTTAGNTTVTITGTGMLNNATHVYFGAQAATSVGAVRVVGSSAVMTATSPATTTSGGPVDVTVAITGATSATSASDVFTYTLVTPTVTAISPLTGTVAGKATVTITGTDFVAGATTVTFGGQAAAATGAVKFVGTKTVVTATAPMTTGTGAVDVQVTTPATTSAPVAQDQFTYYAGIPSISSVSPNNGSTAGGTTVTITGLGLLDGATTVTFGGIAATSVGAVSLSGNCAVMTATSPMTNVAVPVDVKVTTAGGTSAIASTDKFTYTTGTPTVSAISPVTGTTAGNTTVTITGTGLLNNATHVYFGGQQAISVGAVRVVGSSAVMTATSPTTTTSGGPVDVTVAITGATSATSASDVFTYTLVTPTVTAISPLTGTVAGKATVTITGTDFVAGATTVTFGGQAATATGAVKFVGANTVLTATAPMTTGTGGVDVQVTTPATTSAPVSADQFTYFAGVPSISSVSPNTGTSAGGTTVTITGLGLLDGATTVTFGGIAATAVGAVSLSGNSAVMTATSPMTNAAVPVDVKVTTAGGSSALGSTDKFTYTTGTPTVTSISPVTGTTAGNTTVTITGTGMLNRATSVYFGGYAATSVGGVQVVGSNTVLTATSPATTTSGGPVDVTVAITGATSATSASDVFTYTLVTPTVAAISPLTGTVAGKATVTITGTDFVAGATTVTFGGQAAAATGAVKFVGGNTVLTATAPMTTGTGAVDVQVTTPATTSAAVAQDQFTYYAGVPLISSVSPNSGASAGGTTVTITGLGLLDGATTVAFGGVAATSVGPVSLSGNSAVMTATAPMTNAAVPVDVKVTTVGGSSALGGTDKFTYTTGTPTVTNISPLTGTTAGNTTVTITGTGMLNNATHVYFGGQQAASVGSVRVVGSSAVMTATSPATTTSGGPVDVTVAITGATSTTSASDVFTYTLVTPTVTAISPLTGTVAGKATVTITGTDFVAGATTVTFGGQAATATGAVKFVGANTVLTATAPMTTGTGAVDVRVTTPASTSATVAQDQFTYFAGVPSISSVSPNSGTSAGGTTVTITGLGLLDGATTVTFGGIATPSVGAVSLSGNSAVMTATSPMTNAAVPVDVKVTTAGGTSAIVSTDKFTYTTGTPTVSAISPVTGTTAGNTTVTITGTGMLNNATHVYFGPQQAISVGAVRVVGSSAVMTATSPTTTTSGGPVDVTVAITGATSATSASDVFTYTLVTPTVTAISPLTGTVAGKATVTITGTDFVAGATTVTFGGQAAAATGAVKFVGSNTVLTATAPMTTGTGAVDVQVTTPATTSAPVSADHFTYFAGVPSISSVSPNNGASAGGTTVTITGLGLLDGATTVTFGGIAATSVGAVSLSGNSAVMTATSPMTNAATAVDVRVSTTGGNSAIANTDKFTYTTGTPTVSAISPLTGTTAGNTTVTITGTGMLNKATTVYFGSQAATSLGAVTVAGGTSTVMTATTPMTWTSGGPVSVTVAITGFTSTPTASDVFTYTLVTPTVTGISPSSGSVNGGTTVTITGTDFINGHTFVAFGNVMSTKLGPVKFVGSHTVMTATSPVATASGAVDVEMITPAGRSQAVAQDQFTYTGTIGFARMRTSAQHSRRTGTVTAAPPHATPHLTPGPQPAPSPRPAPSNRVPDNALVDDLSPYLPIGQWAQLIALHTK